jgi:hypothetical protein
MCAKFSLVSSKLFSPLKFVLFPKRLYSLCHLNVFTYSFSQSQKRQKIHFGQTIRNVWLAIAETLVAALDENPGLVWFKLPPYLSNVFFLYFGTSKNYYYYFFSIFCSLYIHVASFGDDNVNCHRLSRHKSIGITFCYRLTKDKPLCYYESYNIFHITSTCNIFFETSLFYSMRIHFM